jgi:hypothetical protein
MERAEPIRDPSARTLDQRNRLNEEEIAEIVAFYEAEMTERTKGPQLEALGGIGLAEALRNDPHCVVVEIFIEEAGEVKTIKWPLLIPIEHHEAYDPAFFEKHFVHRNVFYFEMPPHSSLDNILAEDVAEGIAQQLIQHNGVIVYDYRAGDELGESTPDFLGDILERKDALATDVTPPNIAFGVDFGLPTGTYYEGRARIVDPPDQPAESIAAAVREMTTISEGGEQKLLPLPEDGPALLAPAHLEDEELRNELWSMYLKQFMNLGEDHPLYTHSPPDEFLGMLSDPGGINVIAMDEGQVVGLLDLVNKVEKCAWLNPQYYNEKYKDESVWVAFVPGIVVAEGKAQQGLGHAQGMMKLASEVVRATGKDMIIAFGCTGASKTYIPKTVQEFLEGNPTKKKDGLDGFKLDLNERGEGFEVTAEYRHHVLEVVSSH